MPPKSIRITRICPVCSTAFQITPWQASIGKGKACSTQCAARARSIRPSSERFWEKVNVQGSDECWEWQAARNNRGYGIFYFEGRYVLAHRFALELRIGPIPFGLNALHRCDHPSCVNPEHLFAGSLSDNSRDMVLKGRHSSRANPLSIARGSMIASAVLTEVDILAIREQYDIGDSTLKEIGDRFGVSLQTVWSIVHRRSWKHVA